MNEDITSVEKNKNWDHVNYLGRKAINVRWIHIMKLNPSG